MQRGWEKKSKGQPPAARGCPRIGAALPLDWEVVSLKSKRALTSTLAHLLLK